MLIVTDSKVFSSLILKGKKFKAKKEKKEDVFKRIALSLDSEFPEQELVCSGNVEILEMAEQDLQLPLIPIKKFSLCDGDVIIAIVKDDDSQLSYWGIMI